MTAKTPEPSSEPRSAAASTPAPTGAGSGDAADEKATAPATPALPAQAAPAEAAPAPTTPPATTAPATTAPARAAPARAAPGKAGPGKAGPGRAVPPRAAPPAALRARRPDGSGVATVVAVLSLLVSIAASAVAVYSLDVAREAKSRASIATGNDRLAAPAAPTAAATTRAPTASPSPTASPAALFAPELQQAELRIPSPSSCPSIFVDVDALRLGVEAGHELNLSTCFEPPTLRMDRTSGAVRTATVPTPQDCMDQIARSPTPADLVLQVQTGVVVCLLTNAQDAQRQGLPQRVAVVEVRSLGVDRTVTLAITTWRVPT